MELLNSILTWVMKKRIHQIELFMKYPVDVQEEVFKKLIVTAQNTQWGRKFGYSDIKTIRQFQERVPVSSYEQLFPFIERTIKGEHNILWPSEIKWFAKSSGTTNARSKFIPVSFEALNDCHFKGGKDMLSIFVNNHPETKIFAGKSLAIGGSHQVNTFSDNSNTFYGDVSAVIMKNLPFWAQFIRTPSLEIALLDNWEEKLVRISESTINENVTNIAGVPTWTLVLIKRILEITGKKHIHEIWPNLELFAHGAVAFSPYRAEFQRLAPDSNMKYLETYNASEGFFGIQDTSQNDEMLLMLDYGIFYEFIPMEDFESDNPRTLLLSEVEVDKNYAMVISTNGGLWRYKIGDTVKFTSVSPFRIKISGRTKHYINAFGEEVIIENAETAITTACDQTGAIVANFTAAPVYMAEGKRGGHEWVIEFSRPPSDIEKFTGVLDKTLREINSDYDAKRHKDLALIAPIVHSVSEGTFYNWMKQKGKLGGQNKVPRLSNTREYVEDILEMVMSVE
jgi:hypothetical protein